MRTLAIETSGEACSIALIENGKIVAERHERVGRGHAERLIPWIAGFPEGGRADQIITGCGPGSFTGVRIGIAAARGLGLGWGVAVHGISSLTLVAAQCNANDFSVAVEGGHGEILVQGFRRSPDLMMAGDFVSQTPEQAATIVFSDIIIGNGAERLIAARGFGTAIFADPCAASITSIPETLARLLPRPLYGRAPDARPMQSQ